jgi:nicotinamidase-related amidase
MALSLDPAVQQRAALVIMHYQTDVFDILFGDQPSPTLERCNRLIETWRETGRPIVFANFTLGSAYEHAPPATNRQIAPFVALGRFRSGSPVAGLSVRPDDVVYACSRASVFHATPLDADLRAKGVTTLVLAGISTTGVVLSSVAAACDADYDVRVIEACCYDPDQASHQALFASGFGGRVEVI